MSVRIELRLDLFTAWQHHVLADFCRRPPRALSAPSRIQGGSSLRVLAVTALFLEASQAPQPSTREALRKTQPSEEFVGLGSRVNPWLQASGLGSLESQAGYAAERRARVILGRCDLAGPS